MWEIILALICIAIAMYVWCTWNYNYWEKCGIPYIKPLFPFGNVRDMMLLKKHGGAVYNEFYRKYPNEPAVGIYKILTPQLLIRDPELMKTVFIKEFNSFHDNEFEINDNAETIIALNPFLAKGEKWKSLRTFHSHSQSSGKIKGMFELMLDVCQDMYKFVKDNEGKPLEAKYFCGQYTTDVVASTVYGLKTNSFLDPKAEFRKVSAKIFERTWYFHIIITLFIFFPKLTKLLRVRFISKDVEKFLIKVVTDLCEYRKENKISRTDFIQTMLDENLKSDKPKYTYHEITAHSMTFFLDGYETSSLLMSLVIYILSLYPEYQDTLRNEIKENGQISYEEIHKLKYLDAIVNETLRMYPPALITSRLCTKDITIKAGDRSYPITKGMTVALPVYALHMDPTYFPEPEKFNPDKFYNKQNPVTFVPFGVGPRSCLGSRFALTQVKTGVAFLVKHFKIFPRDSDAKLPTITNDSSTFITPPPSGLWVKFETIKDN